MTKTKLETFIKKYSLGGLNSEVRWAAKDGTLKMVEITSDKKLMTSVDLNKFDAFDEAELVVPNTSELKAMLSPLSDNITIELEKGQEEESKRIVSMYLADEQTRSIYQTGDGDHLGSKPKLITIPEYDIEIQLTEDFITRFTKAKAALPNVNNFTLIMSKKKNKLQMVIGHSSNNNTNRIVLDLDKEVVKGKETIKAPTSFSADVLKEILAANSEIKGAVFKVSEQGLAHMEFVSDDFVSKYYMIKIPVEE